MHAYVISKGHDFIERAMSRMLDTAEELHCCSPLANMVMVTELSTSVDLVREILTRRMPEAKNPRKPVAGSDGHLTIWSMPVNDPDCERLMALH